jgi:hypothetical protein
MGRGAHVSSLVPRLLCQPSSPLPPSLLPRRRPPPWIRRAQPQRCAPETASTEVAQRTSCNDCRGFLPLTSKFLSVMCQIRMVGTRDTRMYTGSGLRRIIPYVLSRGVVFLSRIVCSRGYKLVRRGKSPRRVFRVSYVCGIQESNP